LTALATGAPCTGCRGETEIVNGCEGTPGSRNRSAPASTSSTSAASATDRANGPKALHPRQCSAAPPGSGTTPGVGLKPTIPQAAAGTRSDPPPSDPSATAAIPVATATALPPLEPPGVRPGDHGLRVGSRPAPSVNGQIASSGIVVVPTTRAPARRSRATSSSSCAAGVAGVARDPKRVANPCTSTLSLIATGTPASGSDARSSRPRSASASRTAESSVRLANACSTGS